MAVNGLHCMEQVEVQRGARRQDTKDFPRSVDESCLQSIGGQCFRLGSEQGSIWIGRQKNQIELHCGAPLRKNRGTYLPSLDGSLQYSGRSCSIVDRVCTGHFKYASAQLSGRCLRTSSFSSGVRDIALLQCPEASSAVTFISNPSSSGSSSHLPIKSW